MFVLPLSMKQNVCLMMLAASVVAGAQDLMEPLVVTAMRLEQPEEDVPYTVEVRDAEFIRENARRTLPEVLAYSPGVLVQKTANGHGSPFIRGFTGRQNLLLVDGVRLNNSTMRGGPVQYWNTVDVLSIESMELTKSQGSVLYGSDAIGGTLNAFTKSSDFRSRVEGEAFFGGSAGYEFRSIGQGSHIGRLELEAGVGERFGVWLGLSGKDYGDIRDSAVGRMPGTGYTEEDIDFRTDWAVGPESTLTFAFNYVNQDDISRWHRTLGNPGWTHGNHVATPGLWTANTYDQERSLAYLRYAGSNPLSGAPVQRWNATLSYQTAVDSEYQDRNPDSDSIRRSNIELETIGADLTLESDLGPGTLIYGMDFYHDDVDSSGYKTDRAGSGFSPNLPVADDSEYDLFGAFAQYLWKPESRWEITAGARYTYAKASLGRFYDSAGALKMNESQQWDSLVGSLRGLYRINPCWSVFGGISQSFRAPNLNDLTGNVAAKSGGSSLGSTQVEPEDYVTYELGTRHRTDTTSLDFSVYYTDVSDMITSVPTVSGGSDRITTNASEAYVYGVELEGAWMFHPQWRLSGFAGWQDGRTKTPVYLGGPVLDKPMTRQLPLTGSVALRWTADSGDFWVEGRILAADREDRITAADQAADSQRIPSGGTPGYVIASLYAGWEVNEYLDFTCGIENLSDEDYRNHGSGQNEPGLNGIFGVRLAW